MSVIIGNARIDENNRAYGGAAGDQSGREVCTQSWYSYPWNVVIRPTDSTVAEKMAKAMEAACNNNNIGYDQYQRTTLFTKAQELNWDISRVGACETDCSALIAVCCRAAGLAVSKDIYTGNLQAALMATGKFTVLKEAKYLNGDSYLRRGDVLLNTVHHVAMVLSNGANAGATTVTTSTASVASASSSKTVIYGTAKTYKNGSTEEICYADSSLKTKTGSLNPYESCKCLGIVDGRYLVVYQVDGTNHYKCGLVEYNGGL